jgi:hypothetical protein
MTKRRKRIGGVARGRPQRRVSDVWVFVYSSSGCLPHARSDMPSPRCAVSPPAPGAAAEEEEEEEEEEVEEGE